MYTTHKLFFFKKLYTQHSLKHLNVSYYLLRKRYITMQLPKQFLSLNLWTDIDLLYKISMKSYMGSDCLKEIACSNKSIIHSLSLLRRVLEMFIVALNP